MILPLPAESRATEASLRFIDLSGYERFFRDLERGFPSLAPPLPMAAADGIESAPARVIPVHDVGNFEASFIPKMSDFDRLDPRFVISREIWAKIPDYANYSFAVFQLKELAGETHPMAFEFRTRLPDTIFFPTVHIHDGQVHQTEEFDHVLYSQHASYDAVVGDYSERVDSSTQLVRSQQVASQFLDVTKSKGLVDGQLLVHRRQMQGMLPNKDVWLAARGNATQPTLGMSLRHSATLASTIWPLTWVIHRRNQLRGHREGL